MKYCPTCNQVYADDTLNFCFEDRTPLVIDYQNSQLFSSQADTIRISAFQTPQAKSVQAYQQPPTFQKNWVSPRLNTKLYLPTARQTLVERPRLIEQLNEGLNGKLTIISAPAGFGKTSLITSWREQSELPLAWLSLDEEDNEPIRFADYLIGALQTVDENLGIESANMLQLSPAPPLKIVLTSLINEINEFENEFVLAFDDYHLISEPHIHEGLSFFIERLPPHTHALISTRTDPPFPVSRLRARGELKELRASDLRFDVSETATFLNDVMNLELTDSDIAALEGRTEGWITGLQLSALSLQGRENKSDFVKNFAGNDRFILDYLLEEVLHLQPEKVQNFLLQTSVLNRFNGELCNSLTHRNDGHETLDFLNRSNLFLIPLDSQNNWFRYHHLFGDLLQFKLKQKKTDAIVELQTKASLWCEENDLFEEAISYALAAKDWERSLNLIEPIGYQFVSQGKFERLQKWIEAIPETALKTRPMLCFWYVPALLYKDEFEKVEKLLQIIETAEPEELRHKMLSSVWASRCFIAVAIGDAVKAEEFSNKAFELLPPDDVIQFAVAKHTRVAYSLLHGDMQTCEKNLLDALPAYRQANHYLFETWMKTYFGFVRAMQGHLHEGADELRKVISYAKEKIPNRPDPLIYPHSFLCDIHREWNEIETAKTYLNDALTLIQQTGREIYMVLDLQNLKSLVLMLEQCAETKQAENLIQHGLKHLTKYHNQTVIEQINALNALIHLRRGDISFADNWAKTSKINDDETPVYQTEMQYLTFSRLLIAQNKPEQALSLLKRLQNSAEVGSRQRIVIEILVLQSLAHKAVGDEDKALETLQEALELGEPENFVRTFIDEGGEINSLLQTILKQNGKTWETESPKLLNYTVLLLKSFGENTIKKPIPTVPTQSEDLPWWYQNDPLSEREIEVLSLVAQGLSNQQIGDKLFIAAGTVKRHINNIYSKLDVHSRVQAIELARKFGIISPTN